MLQDLKVPGFEKQTPLQVLEPLSIQDNKGRSGQASGYKEVWHAGRALLALKQEKLYEAGGNLSWVDLQSKSPVTADPLTLEMLGWLALKQSEVQDSTYYTVVPAPLKSAVGRFWETSPGWS